MAAMENNKGRKSYTKKYEQVSGVAKNLGIPLGGIN